MEGGKGEGDSSEWGRGLGGRRDPLLAQGPVGPDWDGGENRNANRDWVCKAELFLQLIWYNYS